MCPGLERRRPARVVHASVYPVYRGCCDAAQIWAHPSPSYQSVHLWGPPSSISEDRPCWERAASSKQSPLPVLSDRSIQGQEGPAPSLQFWTSLEGPEASELPRDVQRQGAGVGVACCDALGLNSSVCFVLLPSLLCRGRSCAHGKGEVGGVEPACTQMNISWGEHM